MGIQILERIVAGNGSSLASLTVDQYHQMIATGILPEESQIELLDGLLVLKDRRDRGGKPMNVGTRHATIVTRLVKAAQAVADTDQTHIRFQQPITLPPDNEPEPDAAIVLGQPTDYFDRHPESADILVVMEVADSSLWQDRDVKQRIYANAGVKEYWIVDFLNSHFEVYSQPQPGQGRYGHMQTFTSSDSVSLQLPDGRTVQIAAADVLV